MMDHMEVKSKGYTLKVGIDEDPLNPRHEYEHLGKLLIWHSNYLLGDHNPYKRMKDFYEDKELQSEIILKIDIYLLDHSGLWVSSSKFACDPQGWDSGLAGVIYATKADIDKYFGDVSVDTLQKAGKQLQTEIEEYNSFLSSIYYKYTIEGLEGEHIESGSSFSGDIMEDILNCMKESAEPEYGFLFDKMVIQICREGNLPEKSM